MLLYIAIVFTFGTWNVRSLYRAGSLMAAARELARYKLDYSAIRNIKPLVSLLTLKIIYFAHMHSIVSYGIICGDTSSYSNKILKLLEL
jgi:hypothetical protein